MIVVDVLRVTTILGWVLAVFGLGFVCGAGWVYRKTIRHMREANEILATHVTTRDMIKAMKEEKVES